MVKKCRTCSEDLDPLKFRVGRNECKICENKKMVVRNNIQKVTDPNYYDKQRIIDNKRKKIMRGNYSSEEKFVESLRCLIRKSFKKKHYKKDSRTFDILGIDKNGFMKHIKSQFKEGMTWDNHGLRGWHIDHIIPLSSGKDINEVIKLCHYTNLQPLWWDENLSKGSKIL